ncbi:MAG: hypothetical protein K2Q06_10465, partial [Parvularculaceae bacterium]|nr:hypothetical protein [Parvularculaceae bacterium]
ALMLAAGYKFYEHADEIIIKAMAMAGAAAGVASTLIGAFGVMYHKRKERWLSDRLATERMRQFHFQHYAAHTGDILKGARDPDAAKAYLEKRARDFEAMKASLLNRIEPEFRMLIDSEDPGEGIYFPHRPAFDGPLDDVAAEYFGAYETVRIKRQLDYCNLLLGEHGGWAHAPRRQQKIFGALALVCLISILGLDILAFGSVIVGAPTDTSEMLKVLAILTAFVALSVRTLEEGFQSESEVVRLSQYRFALSRVASRFAEARTSAQKLAQMEALERASYDEMVQFLRSNSKAEFVM